MCKKKTDEQIQEFFSAQKWKKKLFDIKSRTWDHWNENISGFILIENIKKNNNKIDFDWTNPFYIYSIAFFVTCNLTYIQFFINLYLAHYVHSMSHSINKRKKEEKIDTVEMNRIKVSNWSLIRHISIRIMISHCFQ